MESAEYVQRLGTAELCHWLRDTSSLIPRKLEDALKFVVAQKITGTDFLNLTLGEWTAAGLPLGVAASLFQIAKGIRATETAVVLEVPAKGADVHPIRLKRWAALNEALGEMRQKKQKTSAAYSSLTWEVVEPIFKAEIIRYTQIIAPIPQEDMTTLAIILCWIMKSYGSPFLIWNDSKRHHLIDPIIWAVAHRFPDVIVKTGEDLEGKRVNAHGHFEFTLTRGSIRIYILEAKKDNFEQGMAQYLLGCEIAAELNNLQVVYGVITNFDRWIFIKNQDERILCDDHKYRILFDENGVPNNDQLAGVVGKLHGLLLGQ